MPYFVAAEVGYFAGAITLAPIGGDQNPSVLANFWEERFVGGAGVRGYILLVDAIADAAFIELIDDLGAVPVFVEVGEVRQPSL